VKRDFRYAVIGLGGIGSAAAYRLARRAGDDVLGIEQFAIGHDRGASQDHSRIIRLSYHSPTYVRLAAAAYEAWSVLEDDCAQSLILRTGGIDLWPREAAIDIDDYTGAMDACNVPYERLDAAEVMRRWPQFRLEDDVRSVFQAQSGIAPAAKCNTAHIAMARAHGATLLEHRPVESLRAVDGEIEIACGNEVFRCARVVVAADAWTNQVIGSLGASLPLTVTQEQVTYFATPNLDEFSPDRFPIWIWMDEPSFYGFPVYGEAGTKAAQDVGGHEVTADARSFEPDPEALSRVTDWLEKHLPSALGPQIYTKTCLYTMPPDRDFVIDAIPGHPEVLVGLGAAHGFKFAALFGRLLAEIAIDGAPSLDVSDFAFDRSALTDPGFERTFIV
jgi:sarcosine oxidase